jgi:GNAT superfamily N-acetyltransferase
MPRLFHFSDDPAIARFEPRPVRTPSERGAGRDWLNGPLVWAIEDERQALYLFPRECPRILLWLTPATTEADRAAWWGGRDCAAIAHIEWAWLERLRTGSIWRYELPVEAFEDLDDAGMWVSRRAVEPVGVERIDDLPSALRAEGVELRVMESLRPLKGIWGTSLHASGVRLRNAAGWDAGLLTVRLARTEDAALLPDVELSAGRLFRAAPGLEWISRHGEPTAETYRPFIAAGTTWVAEAADGRLVGYVACEVVGEAMHVWQLSVAAEAQGEGLGRQLMGVAQDQALALGLSAVTLTTFRDVPWNAPFYARLGYRALDADALDARLAGVLRAEIENDLPAEQRCAMRLELQ